MEQGNERLTTADLAQSHGEPELDRDLQQRAAAPAGDEDRQPLLEHDDADELRGRWDELQVRFVDEPRRSVEEADALVAELMQRLAESFAAERSRLEAQWDRGDQVSTEDLRVALQRYRSFFGRLLAA